MRGGLSQIKALKEDKRFAKMHIEEPPIVEAEDLAFLNEIYAEEFKQIGRMFPKTRTLWEPLTLENY